MCGIAGYLHSNASHDELVEQVGRMTSALSHRGPDDSGVWADANYGLALGHRRLAVRDLSPAGHQPMFSADGAWGLVYNGEIYNTEELRAALPTHLRWRGHSDTEVLLEGFRHWGVGETIRRVAGMFAIAVWDRARATVTLIRDRLGIKPLYYSIQGSRYFWASELKALLAHSDFIAEPDPLAVHHFLQLGYIPAPTSILRRTWKLAPGTMLKIDLRLSAAPQQVRYWNLAQVAEQNRQQQLQGEPTELIAETGRRLNTTIRGHQVSDVRLGTFLSGGIDSSLVTSIMQSQQAAPIDTFSIGFDQPKFDEAPYARQIAHALGTNHHELYVTDRDVCEWVPRWSEFYSEPFSDTSSLPTLLVSQFARQQVKVVLTGDGGDELFAGYRRYQTALNLARRLRRLPGPVRTGLSQVLGFAPPHVYRHLNGLQRLLAAGVAENLGESVRKFRAILETRGQRQLYDCLVSVSYHANRTGLIDSRLLTTGGTSWEDVSASVWNESGGMVDQMQQWDSSLYLPNDILHKVDIASMAFGLEVRVPLLDHRLFEWSWRLPAELKLAGGQGKVVLRQLLAQRFPADWFARQKRGFSAPVSDWLRGPLRAWAESLISSAPVLSGDLLHQPTLKQYWQDLISGRTGHARIWPVLVYLDWSQRYLRQSYLAPPQHLHEHRLRYAGRDSLSIGG